MITSQKDFTLNQANQFINRPATSDASQSGRLEHRQAFVERGNTEWETFACL
jgi:hypothetical protein